MNCISPSDKLIRNKGYNEEYCGLEELPAWSTISEVEYQHICHVVDNALPTMALSIIKYDENGKLSRV